MGVQCGRGLTFDLCRIFAAAVRQENGPTHHFEEDEAKREGCETSNTVSAFSFTFQEESGSRGSLFKCSLHAVAWITLERLPF